MALQLQTAGSASTAAEPDTVMDEITTLTVMVTTPKIENERLEQRLKAEMEGTNPPNHSKTAISKFKSK